MNSKKRFAVGAEVRVIKPGMNGVVKQMISRVLLVSTGTGLRLSTENAGTPAVILSSSQSRKNRRHNRRPTRCAYFTSVGR